MTLLLSGDMRRQFLDQLSLFLIQFVMPKSGVALFIERFFVCGIFQDIPELPTIEGNFKAIRNDLKELLFITTAQASWYKMLISRL